MDMTPWERRQRILEILCLRRHETCSVLAHEFHVSTETIYHDITILTCDYPIETVQGGHGGGVKVADWFHLDRRTLNCNQITFLRQLAAQLDEDNREKLNRIIVQFSR